MTSVNQTDKSLKEASGETSVLDDDNLPPVRSAAKNDISSTKVRD